MSIRELCHRSHPSHWSCWSRPSRSSSHRSRGLTLAAALIGGFLIAGAALAEDGEGQAISTNLDLIRGVTRDAVGQLLDGFAPPGRRLLVKVEPYHETAWMVEDLVGIALRERGYEIVSGGGLPAAAAATPPPAAASAQPPKAPPADAPSQSLADAAQAQAALGGAAAAGDSAAAGAPGDSGGDESGGESGDESGGEAGGDAGGDAGAKSGGDAGAKSGSDAGAKTGAGSAGGQPAGSEGSGASGDSGSGSAAADAGTDAELRLRVVELGLSYTGSRRTRLLFGSRLVERYATARIHGELRAARDPAVRWTGDGESLLIDEVPADAISILEGQRYPFSAPNLPTRDIGRVVEPIIVSTIVVGLVFLFVSNRS